MEKMAFIMHPSIAIKKLQTGADSCPRDDAVAKMRLNLGNVTPMPWPSAHTCMLV